MRRLVRALPAAAILLAAARPAAAPTPSPALLVLSKGDHVLSIVDPATRAVVAQMPSGPDPHEVEASADGRMAYVTNYGGGGAGALNTITPIDLVAQRTLPTIDLGAMRGPHGLAFVGGQLWFTAEGADAVGSYDPATRRVERVLETGQEGTHMVYVSADRSRLVTTNVRAGTLTIADRRAPGEWTQTVVQAGGGVEGFDVTPDGREVWAASARDGTIAIVDLAAKRVVQTLDAHVDGANRLKITPDGRLALVSTLRGPDVTVFDVAARREVKRIPVGRGAAGIVIQPDGARAYVACTPDDYVAVIDLKALAVAGRVVAGRQPDGLAWAVRR
ncbi:hypothetical protein J421_4702 (plasmid) [Gemmatirosa kalamazoonensis]|jgi:YVTN family beta-propeller protein|uniref:40-residue YVTN family beta-propeller repeat protein n=1 Tax=Gemmatirosa kalamazoonensis TaxID=861299 RepID=W0RP27_9BACT|nr:cytochrome D1 domain-containing protein [Gemmatirosa kalamazoonensis]AHG92237.1 hypothetical protein J421_4702 [Gemmatirosa kalamazoonensis]